MDLVYLLRHLCSIDSISRLHLRKPGPHLTCWTHLIQTPDQRMCCQCSSGSFSCSLKKFNLVALCCFKNQTCFQTSFSADIQMAPSSFAAHESALTRRNGDQDSSLPHANLLDQRARSNLFKPVQISTRAREEIQPHRQEVAADVGDVFSFRFLPECTKFL